jgi:hypothetical protein
MSNKTWFWVVSLAVQAVLTLAWRLAENALLGWGDEQIGALFGITSPALSTVAAWMIPFLLAAGTLWGYHWIQIRWFHGGAVAIHTIGSPRGEALESIVSQIPRHLYVQAATAEKTLGSKVILGWVLIIGSAVGLVVGIILLTTNAPTFAPTKSPSAPPSPQAAAAPAPLPGRPTIPRVAYTERDIREMLDALDEAQDLVEKRMMPIYTPIQGKLINAQYSLTQLGLKQTIHDLNDAKNSIQTNVWEPINNFVYKEHSGYQNEMRVALALDDETAKGELTRAIQAIIDRLKLFPEDPDKIEQKSVGLVLPEYEAAEKLGNQFWSWLNIAQSRIKEMKNNLRTKGITGYEAP